MMEMKIKIEVPDLAAAIEKLAASITPPDLSILTPDEPMPPANPTPAPAPATMATPAPTAMSGQTAAPTNAPAPAPAPVPGPVPTAAAPTYTLDQISKAGAALVDAGKMEQLLALLAKYGVQAITQLQPTQYGVFATELRALGAQI